MQPESPWRPTTSNISGRILAISIVGSVVAHGVLLALSVPEPKALEVPPSQKLVMIETVKKPVPKPVLKEPPPKPKEEPKKTVSKSVKPRSAPPRATAQRTLLSSKAPTPTDAGTVSDVQIAGSRGLSGTEFGGEELPGATRSGVVGGTGGTDTVEAPPPPPPLIEAKAKLGTKKQPEYPEVAQQNNWEGRVLLSAYIKEDGSIGEVKVEKSSGHGELDKAAIAALRDWRFEPAKRGDVAQGSWVRVPFTFTLQ